MLTPFCANCSTEVAPEAGYCPKCGFRGVVESKPEGLRPRPRGFLLTSGGPLLHLRRLSWGIILLAVWMALIAQSGILETVAPSPPSPGVYLVDMSAAQLAVAGALALLPIACLLLLGLGLLALTTTVPEVRSRLRWRAGPFLLGPLRLVGLVFLGIVLAVVIEVALVLAALLDGRTPPEASILVGAAFEALLIAFGWCLMVFPAKALGPWTSPLEARATFAATIVISAAAMFEAGVQFVAASLTSNPNANTPYGPPWTQGFSALTAFAGLLVVAWVARRIVHRLQRAPVQTAPSPA